MTIIYAGGASNSTSGSSGGSGGNVDESNLVHKTGDETITGVKTFNGTLSTSNLSDVVMPMPRNNYTSDFSNASALFKIDSPYCNYEIKNGISTLDMPGEPKTYAYQECSKTSMTMGDLSTNLTYTRSKNINPMSVDEVEKISVIATTPDVPNGALMEKIIDKNLNEIRIIWKGMDGDSISFENSTSVNPYGITYSGFEVDSDSNDGTLVTSKWVNTKIDSSIGNINTALDEINGENI